MRDELSKPFYQSLSFLETEMNLMLTYQDAFEEKVQKLLKQVETHLNKRGILAAVENEFAHMVRGLPDS